MEKLLSIKEAAKILSVQEESIRHWIRSGKLDAVKAGRVWRVKPSAIDNFLEPRSEEEQDTRQADMFFKNDYHRDLYINMLANIPSSGFKHNLACYVLAAIGKTSILEYMQSGIDIDNMIKKIDSDSNEEALLQIAGNLYNGRACDMNILSRLDKENLLVVMEAIKGRYMP